MPSSSISSAVAFETFLLAKVFIGTTKNTFANKKVSNATTEDIEDEGIHKLIDIFDHYNIFLSREVQKFIMKINLQHIIVFSPFLTLMFDLFSGLS
jgi:hypothetical protein